TRFSRVSYAYVTAKEKLPTCSRFLVDNTSVPPNVPTPSFVSPKRKNVRQSMCSISPPWHSRTIRTDVLNTIAPKKAPHREGLSVVRFEQGKRGINAGRREPAS
ncbi:unnamed protein product, partial [Ectocarpus sp. 13 AM-2016]